jgi:hypothetical protein
MAILTTQQCDIVSRISHCLDIYRSRNFEVHFVEIMFTSKHPDISAFQEFLAEFILGGP